MTKKILKSMLLFSVLGAAISTFCDFNHAYSGAISYPQPFFSVQPWWPFPGFTIAFLAMSLLYIKFAPLVKSNYNRMSSGKNSSIIPFIESMSIYAAIYLMSGFGWKDPVMLNIIFYSIFVIRLIFTYDRLFIFIAALILAAGGILGEGLLVKFNLVVYKNPEIFGVPFWLGGIYMHGAMVLREGMKFFVYKEEQC